MNEVKKIFLMGRNLPYVAEKLVKNNFEIVDDADDCDLIVTHGGDGAILGAERAYPGKLKYPIRDSQTAPLCENHSLDVQVEMLKKNLLSESVLQKVCIRAKGKEFYGINDCFVHGGSHTGALRCEVSISGEVYAGEVVCDAVGLSTVHGATAYYKSITRSVFRIGMGLSFSNSTELVNHLVLPTTDVVEVKILRGPAEAVCDNDTDRIYLETGDTAELFMSDRTARMLGVDVFMCPVCRMMRHYLRNSSRYS